MQEGLPRIGELGEDLLASTAWQRWQPALMPLLWAIGFMVAWHFHIYWVTALCLVMAFSASSTSTHDVVHGSLGIARRETEWLLFFLGAAILESGHAYRFTHLEHHRIFPSHEDLEGEAAHMPVWRVLLEGPTFLPRIWFWAWGKASRKPTQRRWLLVEAALPMAFLLMAWLVLPWSSAPMAYWVAAIVASWFYPLFAVHLPHRHFGESRLSHAWTLRGRLIPRLFLPLAYHLEHHLYPMVPSHNLPRLAERLEPHLRERGVRLLHVP